MEFSQTLKKFRKLEKLNSKYQIFEIQEPYTLNEVIEFENYFKIELPQHFKKFITECSKGITDDWKDILSTIDLNEFNVNDTNYNPAIEFKPTTRIQAFSDERERKMDKRNFPFDTKYEFFKGDEHSNGSIAILGQGCGAYDFIVVNGKEYGNVWADNYMSNSEIFPEFDTELGLSRIDFSFWINKQLDLGLREIDKKRNPIEILKTLWLDWKYRNRKSR